MRRKIFEQRLFQLYRTLDYADWAASMSVEARTSFWCKIAGEFVSILRARRNMHGEALARELKIPVERLYAIERGDAELNNLDFFRTCKILGAGRELPIFIIKVSRSFRALHTS